MAGQAFDEEVYGAASDAEVVGRTAGENDQEPASGWLLRATLTMRVLLTRALEDAARTRETLESLGHRVLVSPVISTETIGANWPDGVVDAVLATSGKAFVASTAGWGPAPEARRLMPLWLVGHRTEEAARAAGFLGPTHVAPQTPSPSPSRWASVASAIASYIWLDGNRKPDIETALSVMDQAIDVVENLRSGRGLSLGSACREGDHRRHRRRGPSTFSRRSAALFADLVLTAGLNPRTLHVCLSADVAAALKSERWHTSVATEPTEVSMIAALAALEPT